MQQSFGDEGEGGDMPFHPQCFELFKRVSDLRLGKVDLDGLWMWRQVSPGFQTSARVAKSIKGHPSQPPHKVSLGVPLGSC